MQYGGGGRKIRGQHTMDQSVNAVLLELESLPFPVSNIIISTNVETRRDGYPYSGRAQPKDTGAAVYFSIGPKREPRVLACDKWDRVEDNLWAIASHIESIRAQIRWGVGETQQAFAGYTALPGPGESSSEPWWVVLGVASHTPTEDVKLAYRQLVLLNHPDRGGNTDTFLRIQKARDEFYAERGLK